MTTEECIAILKTIVKEQIVSVGYHQNGKCYYVPMALFFMDITNDPFSDQTDDMPVYISCEYKTAFGVIFMQCSIMDENGNNLITPMSVPLDPKKQTPTQRAMVSLINLCSKHVIAQEMSRTKYAITSAINSVVMNKEYN